MVDAEPAAQQSLTLLLGAARFVDQRADKKQRGEPYRHIDERDPVPGIGVADPAAQGWTDDRRDNDGDAVDRKRLSALTRVGMNRHVLE